MNINKAHVRRQFNRSATCYDNVAVMQRYIVDALLAELPSTPEFKIRQLCDIGCGTGYGLSSLRKAYPFSKPVGLDLAPAMLQQAELAVGSNKAYFLQGDIEALPFAPNSMDLCISSSAIQWCDAETAVRQISNVLRPDGQVLISSFLFGTLQNWRELWGRNDQNFLRLSDFKNAFSGSGLVLEKLWTEPYIQSFGSFNDAQKSIRSLGAGNASSTRPKGLMGRAKLKQIIEKVDHIVRHNGSIDLHYEVVYAKASKAIKR